jgi:hypothetical protein
VGQGRKRQKTKKQKNIKEKNKKELAANNTILAANSFLSSLLSNFSTVI